MKVRSLLPVLFILLGAACVDRIFFDLGNTAQLSITIDGHISDEPGPYTIKISNEYDIESRYSFRSPVTGSKVVLSDDLGNSETLSEKTEGNYHTHPSGMRGAVGRVYKLTVELLDGRTYESRPDTLTKGGTLDSLYYELKEEFDAAGKSRYGFDFFFDTSTGDKSNYRFMWQFTGTFRADTNPEAACSNPPALTDCFPCGNKLCLECNPCNYKPPCSGLRNYGVRPQLLNAVFVRVAPCSCCTCWYNIYNPAPILGEGQFIKTGQSKKVFAHNIPLNAWVFQDKVHVEVAQMSLSAQSMEYWRSIKSQREAINSLFQPLTGKFPQRFTELNGSRVPASGLFFATSISHKRLYVSRLDVNPQSLIPEGKLQWNDSCLTLFPNATTDKPSFWVD